MHYEVKHRNELYMTQDLREAAARADEISAKAGHEVTAYRIEIAYVSRAKNDGSVVPGEAAC